MSATKDIERVMEDNRATERKANKQGNILYGGMGLFYLALTVLCLVTESWLGAATVLVGMLWLALLWMQDREINQRQRTISTMVDLRKLEKVEYEKLMFNYEKQIDLLKEELAAKPKRKAAKVQ